MALPGMKSTADFATNERPGNYRAGVLMRSPRDNAPLYALTAAMKSEKSTDPKFSWWEEEAQMFGFGLGADLSNVATTVTLNASLYTGATQLKPGDMLIVNGTGEAIRVVTVVSSTSITVTRAMGPGGTAAGTAAAQTVAGDPKLLYVGSAYREGAPRSIGVSYNPVEKDNVTQIFRDPIEWTRTASQTTFRTGDPMKEDKRRALHKHSMGIERAFWMGTRYETLEAGQPLRFTDGFRNFIPAANIKTFDPAGTDLDELESYFPGIFAFGSKEKVAWGSIATLQKITSIIRKNSNIELGPVGEKEYGMDVRRIYTGSGTLTFMEHPLFGQAGQFMAEDLLIMDMANLRYRYVQDTIYLKDRHDNGTDGKTDEFLTECGLEVHHGVTHYWLKALKSAKKDD